MSRLRHKVEISNKVFSYIFFVLVSFAAVWLWLLAENLKTASRTLYFSNDDLMIQEIDDFDFDAGNQSFHIPSKRLNTFLNLISQKEVIFDHQLKKLKVLSFRSSSSPSSN